MKKLLLSFLVGSFLLGAGTVLAESTSTPRLVKKMDTACVQKAVAVREAAIVAAYTKMTTTMTTAFNSRAAALNTAWGLTDVKARRAAINEAWNKFRTAKKTAIKTNRQETNAAWKTFKTEAKKCKVDPSIETATGEKTDNSME